ncbi:MFS transporter [Galbitalea sp. SE-J8]|uniref:MFS transporter n=1 Tax=Galbitalea sp. SE-J8 TaxID=3054952 RepID=UPI00259CC985|nr:MFS transporter [Galbitalea sp. SE-J8]MDM4761711.1 MFS transporter [Galbitalea sp. SE-J8]
MLRGHGFHLDTNGTSIHYGGMERKSITAERVKGADRTAMPRTLRAAWPALAGLAAVFLIEMLDTSVLNVALPTIARDLSASASELQWTSGSYALVFGGLMLAFGAVADRFGRRRVMLIGLAVFGLASLSILLVSSPIELIIVRVFIGIAAAMTAPGSMALSFRLFDDDALRVRATALISTVGLVGIAIGPTIGGLVLAVAPWQVLLLVNVPITLLAFLGIRFGIRADTTSELHRVPIDVLGALLGTAAIVLALLAPTLFVDLGAHDPWPWIVTVTAVAGLIGFLLRQRLAAHPLIDLALFQRPSVATGLTHQAALGLATAGLGYTVTLQLQLAWGWPPALAALGTLPQVLAMIAIGPLVERIVTKVGLDRAAAIGSAAVIVGLLAYALCGHYHYTFIAIALVLVAAGMRITMITATINVMRGLPADRTSIGAALNDTAQEIASGIGTAVVGIIIAASIAGALAGASWSPARTAAFQNSVTLGVLALTATSVVLLAIALIRTALDRNRDRTPAERASTGPTQQA